MKTKYSIILPCFNEYGNLKLLLPQLFKIFKNENFEFIVVDDNSDDETVFKLKKIFKNEKKIRYILRKKNRSLGLSIKEGILSSNGNVLIVMDTDFNHRPADLNKMLNTYKKRKYDMICGSRFLKGGSSTSLFRYVSSYLFNVFINLITRGSITDNLSGFFIIEKKIIIKNLKKIFYGYGDFYIRLLFFVQKKNITIKEIPVRYDERKYGVSKSKLFSMLLSYSLETIKVVIKN